MEGNQRVQAPPPPPKFKLWKLNSCHSKIFHMQNDILILTLPFQSDVSLLVQCYDNKCPINGWQELECGSGCPFLSSGWTQPELDRRSVIYVRTQLESDIVNVSWSTKASIGGQLCWDLVDVTALTTINWTLYEISTVVLFYLFYSGSFFWFVSHLQCLLYHYRLSSYTLAESTMITALYTF